MEAAAGALGEGAALLLGLCALFYYTFVATTWCQNAVSLRGKTVLITGIVNTKISRSHPWWTLWLVWIMKLFIRNCNAGAQTSIYCATKEGIERLSGRDFVDCRPKVPSPLACDDQLAKKLWEFSERLLGLSS